MVLTVVFRSEEGRTVSIGPFNASDALPIAAEHFEAGDLMYLLDGDGERLTLGEARDRARG
jgi:hypothetical protein